MPRIKLTAAQKELKQLKSIKEGQSRSVRGAVNELAKRVKAGTDFTDLEKKLTSKQIKDVINTVNEHKFGKGFAKIGRYYKSTSKAARSIEGFRAIKLSGGPMGWIGDNGRIWTKVDSLETLNSLDAVKGMRFDDTLVNQWSMANGEQKAEISKMLSEFDWEDVWTNVIQSDEKFKKVSNGDRVAKRKTFLTMIHDRIDEILSR